MRPHALSMTAFGPFVDTVSLDLEALSSAGLFLLHGPTGAGKSTLLDGICFALFGRVPGVRNAAKRLRCDSAPPGVRTTVTLEATFGGRRIRITRSPSYTRPKTRGTGEATEQAKVLLEELRDGAWEVLSARPREADDEVLYLVGMSAEQFFQVVLLPQGEFATFLRASSADRVELLKKLFATEHFADVEHWLAARRRLAAERVAVQRDVVGDLVARLAEVCAVDVPLEPSVAWAARLQASAVAAAEELDARLTGLTVTRDTCRAAVVEAERVAGLQQRRRHALARQAQLAAGRAARLELAAELDAAARAAEAAPLLTALSARRAARDRLLATTPDVGLAELRIRQQAAQTRCGALEALRTVDEGRRDALGVVGRASAENADALAAAAAAELELAVLPARRDELDAHVQAAREAALSLPQLTATRAALAALRPDLVELGRAGAQLSDLREQLLSARETAVALETKALDLRVASINSMVARLAAMLEDGVPCEVCGSPTHPDPSAHRDEGVTPDDEEQARRLADDAQLAVSDLTAQVAALESRAAVLAERVGDRTLASLDQELAALDLTLDLVRATAEQLEVRELDLSQLDERRTALKEELVAASARADAAARRGVEATARAAAAARELEAAGAADLAAALEEAVADSAWATAALLSAEALEVAQVELTAAEAAGETACAAAGFASRQDTAHALRTAEWRTATTAELRAAADLEAALTAELADPSLDVALDAPAPLAQSREALAAADEALGDALGRLEVERQRCLSLERLVPALSTAVTVLVPLEAEAARVRGLADLCAGGGANGLRMTLTSFVLAARLEEVAAAATVRLLRMTQGRYELVHTDGSARGGARSGLGLLVRDAWTGQDRDTATLSGGETFLASLSLALGLADVVTAEAGGARIGALFVDEGFGTLDEESLDEVMDVLDGLREGGRVVGVVSHVGELRQRIPTRVEVRKARVGSAVAVHGC